MPGLGLLRCQLPAEPVVPQGWDAQTVARELRQSA
jgi:hypothetical protein